MIQTYLWKKLEEINKQRMWFQQDRSTSHTSKQTIHLFKDRFFNRIISRGGDVNWPPRLCDLTHRTSFFGFF